MTLISDAAWAALSAILAVVTWLVLAWRRPRGHLSRSWRTVTTTGAGICCG